MRGAQSARLTRSCFRTSRAPKGRASTALGNAQGFEAETSRPSPVRAKHRGLSLPFRAYPNGIWGLMTQAAGLGFVTSPLSGLRFRNHF